MNSLLLTLAIFLPVSAFSMVSEGPGHGSGPAHPAAFLCEKLGGQKVFASAEGGTIEYCALDEAKISSMTLWYTLNGHTELATNIYLDHATPPEGISAADYCRYLNGHPETLISYDGQKRSDSCDFDDRGHWSSIDQETLLRGPAYPGNSRLTDLLTGR